MVELKNIKFKAKVKLTLHEKSLKRRLKCETHIGFTKYVLLRDIEGESGCNTSAKGLRQQDVACKP